MPGIPGVPEELVTYLFNFDQGKHLDTYCSSCRQITDQVVISYSQLPEGSADELAKFAGRLLDIIPGTRLFMGKPTICRCGTVNR
jgi:hypothetical protein